MKNKKVTKKEWFGLLIGITLIAIYALSGCTAPAVGPAKTEQVYQAAWDSHKDGKQFTELTVKALETYGTGLLALEKVSDDKTFCPKYSTLTKEQRKAFYVALVSAITQRESDFNTDETYQEDFNDVQGRPVVSTGLLQISKESANQKAYSCGIAADKDLHDPRINISCGVRILSYWLPRDGAVGTDKKGGARYWSVLRESSKSRDKIISYLKTLTFCQ